MQFLLLDQRPISGHLIVLRPEDCAVWSLVGESVERWYIEQASHESAIRETAACDGDVGSCSIVAIVPNVLSACVVSVRLHYIVIFLDVDQGLLIIQKVPDIDIIKSESRDRVLRLTTNVLSTI